MKGLIGIFEQHNEYHEDRVRYIRVGQGMYPEHVGVLLKHKYDTEEKIYQLLALGDLAHLGMSCETYRLDEEMEPLTMQHPYPDKCRIDPNGNRFSKTVDVNLLSGIMAGMCKAASVTDNGFYVFIHGRWCFAKI